MTSITKSWNFLTPSPSSTFRDIFLITPPQSEVGRRLSMVPIFLSPFLCLPLSVDTWPLPAGQGG